MPTTKAADAIRAPFAELGIRTHEDIEEANAANGWGCKCCGELSSPSWWTCLHGDIYCLGCKRHMASELRIRFVAFPTRATAGLQRTVVHTYNPASQGFEVAAWQRAEHARMYA